MTFPKNESAPYHVMRSESEMKRQVKSRYQRLRADISEQVVVLQRSKEFCDFASGYYTQYRDWTILNGVYNCMLDWRGREVYGVRWLRENPHEQLKVALDRVKGSVYPAFRFVDKVTFERSVLGHLHSALKACGFDLRYARVDNDLVTAFLKDRLGFFDIDYPHKPLFGNPPGEWPLL
jgi:hypothetical protein